MDYDETDPQEDDGYHERQMERTPSDQEFLSAESFFQSSNGGNGFEAGKFTNDVRANEKDSHQEQNLGRMQTTRKVATARRTLQQQNTIVSRTSKQNSLTSRDTKSRIMSGDSAIWSCSPRTTGELETTDSARGSSHQHAAASQVKTGTFQDTVQAKQDCGTSLKTIEPSNVMDMNKENNPESDTLKSRLMHSDNPRTKRKSVIEDIQHKEFPMDSKMQGLKRTSSVEKRKTDKEMTLSENLAKLHIHPSRSNKKRSDRKQKDKDMYQKIQQHLKCLPPDDLKELSITQDNDGDNLLMIAIIEGCVPLTTCLIQLAPFPNLLDIRNNLGQTALHLAVITRQYKLARNTVLAGGNLLACDFIGNTPLHVACSSNDIDSVISLTKVVTSLECPSEAKRQSLQVPQPSEIYNHKGET